MRIWNWIYRNRNRTTRADGTRHFSTLGNAIDPEWRSGWCSDDSGFYETRQHVGRSAEGFHAGVEISYRVYHRIVWGEAHATPEKAREAAREMESRRTEEIEDCPQFDRALDERR